MNIFLSYRYIGKLLSVNIKLLINKYIYNTHGESQKVDNFKLKLHLKMSNHCDTLI